MKRPLGPPIVRLALCAGVVLCCPGIASGQVPTVEYDGDLRGSFRDAIERALEAPGVSVWTFDTIIARNAVHPGSIVQLGGTLVVEGRVEGNVTAVGSEVYVRPGARLSADLLVIGGTYHGTSMATLEGRVEWWKDETVEVVEIGRDSLEVESDAPEVGFPFELRGFSGLVVHEYNGVDGLSAGFEVGLKPRPGRPLVQLYGGPVFRTERDEVGWRVVGSRESRSRRTAFGGDIHSITDSNEHWHRGDLVNSIASLAFAHDDRVYFERRGYEVWAEARFGGPVAFRLRWRDDDYSSLESQPPLALFADDEDWPVNPEIEDGQGRALGIVATYDGRDDSAFPTRGAYTSASYDHWGFDGDYEFDWVRAEAQAFVPAPLTAGSFLSLRIVGGRPVGDISGLTDRLPPQFWTRLGGSGSIAGYEGLTTPLTGDRFALANVRFHLALPVTAEVLESAYLIGLVDVGDAWFEDEDADPRSGIGGGLGLRLPRHMLGVFAAYGVEDENWEVYGMIRWF